ncbi:PF07611 family protein [Leptospira fainei serovar Hurstbridge str. BUT 6]|uniref:PF07611 family protein n=1 Tax=Leptospira fainei serovar Hurstbridge str. BUT 6 TaxID=1193011 RepID=S3VH51_9LEPT|nr:DUF1574 domain-containing protein [Leptospira fainei]EPG75820.1 PF07611 family protein [Leptospira fainei serovar Hurstbridge str. BUT 6]
MKRIFIYYPFLFLLFLFCADKIFTLEYFRDSFYQDGNPVYYSQRRSLFQRMLKDPKIQERNLAIAFGDSRAYPYSEKALEEKMKKDWVLYNFAGPQAVPAYGLYWLRKSIQAGVKPKVVFYVVSPEAFDDTKGLMYEPFLRLGADEEFIRAYWNNFTLADKLDLLKERIFAYRKVKPSFKLFWSRLTSGDLDEYDPVFNDERIILDMTNGEQMAYATATNNPKKLSKDAIRLKSIYLSGFEVSDTQFFFVEEFLKLSKENGIVAYIVWPRVYDGYRKGYYELGLDKIWWPRIRELANKYDARSVDMNVANSCDKYYDASHQDIFCIVDQIRLLMNDYYGKSKLPR